MQAKQSQVKRLEVPKKIFTELGAEKFCKHCQEYWPMDEEFFYWQWTTSKKTGERYKQFGSVCKACYDVYYNRRSNRKVGKIRSFHEKI